MESEYAHTRPLHNIPTQLYWSGELNLVEYLDAIYYGIG